MLRIFIVRGQGIKIAHKQRSLFGSYVRGEAKDDSDIDILVDLPEELSLFDVVDIQLKLEDVLGKKVDLVEYNSIKPRIRDQILNEQIPIL